MQIAQPAVLRARNVFTIQDVSNMTWTAMPAALDDFRGATGNARGRADLTGYSEIRIACNILFAAFAGAELRGMYSTDGGSVFNYFVGNTPAIVIDSTGHKVSAWVALPAAAQADVIVRIVGIGGNATVAPQFGTVMLQAR